MTVSPRLRRELNQRYDGIASLETTSLPPIQFFSLRELIGQLVRYKDPSLSEKIGINLSETCTFIEYIDAKAIETYERSGVDTKEAESECCFPRS